MTTAFDRTKATLLHEIPWLTDIVMGQQPITLMGDLVTVCARLQVVVYTELILLGQVCGHDISRRAGTAGHLRIQCIYSADYWGRRIVESLRGCHHFSIYELGGE
jgi:hypothetical protein